MIMTCRVARDGVLKKDFRVVRIGENGGMGEGEREMEEARIFRWKKE